ncbi:MAG: hypothetical protein C0391_02935 [Anaerolinea sp.]|nr:hypothetical protein [Anaerolinea sp.]
MAEKILIVDDDLDTLRLVRLVLQKQGYEIVEASNGEQALDMVKTNTLDLILLDLMMPGMDGYEVAQRIRRNEIQTHIPILMFSAKSQVEDKVSGYAAGGDSYITKPTHPDELLAVVRNLLANSPNLKITPDSSKHKVIGILSVKGGIGTTTLALNTSIGLKKTRRVNVLLVELRPSLGSLAEDLGLPQDHVLENLLQPYVGSLNDAAIQSEIIPHTTGIKLLLCSSDPDAIIYQKDTAKIAEIVKILKRHNEYVILDIGMNVLSDLDTIIALCDQILLTIEPAANSLSRAKKLLEYLEARGFPQSRPLSIIIVNRIRSEMQLTMTNLQENLHSEINLAVSPVPEFAAQAWTKKIPMIELDPNSLTAQQYNQIAQAIIRV